MIVSSIKTISSCAHLLTVILDSSYRFRNKHLLNLCPASPLADPNIMKKLQVDRGAIRFVLAGANIMCPGLTSPGGALDDEVEAETPVV